MGLPGSLLAVPFSARLLVIAIFIPGAWPAACDGGRPCVVSEEGMVSYDNSQVYRTAVGCTKSFSVNFRAGVTMNATAPAVTMCDRQSSGACLTMPGTILTEFQRRCCEVPFRKASTSSTPPLLEA